MQTQTNCPFCKSKARSLWRDGSFFECDQCHLLIRNTKVSSDDLDELYRASWGSPYEKTDETGATTARLAKLFVDHLSTSLSIRTFQGMVILDYGAGRGSMSYALQEAGADVYAVEPYGYDFLQANGLKAFKSIEDLPAGLAIDGVVSLDVVEHLSKPWDDLKQIQTKMTSGGWVFLSTPNCRSLNARVSRHTWREARRAGHLFLFNETSLRKQLEFSDFHKIQRLNWDVNYDPTLPVRIKDWILAKMALDGELRYIAFKP